MNNANVVMIEVVRHETSWNRSGIRTHNVAARTRGGNSYQMRSQFDGVAGLNNLRNTRRLDPDGADQVVFRQDNHLSVLPDFNPDRGAGRWQQGLDRRAESNVALRSSIAVTNDGGFDAMWKSDTHKIVFAESGRPTGKRRSRTRRGTAIPLVMVENWSVEKRVAHAVAGRQYLAEDTFFSVLAVAHTAAETTVSVDAGVQVSVAYATQQHCGQSRCGPLCLPQGCTVCNRVPQERRRCRRILG